MDDVSRRSLLTTASVGAVAVGAVAVAGPLTGRGKAGAPEVSAKALTDPLVARVRDLEKGEIEFFNGVKEVIVTDKALANRLARAAQS